MGIQIKCNVGNITHNGVCKDITEIKEELDINDYITWYYITGVARGKNSSYFEVKRRVDQSFYLTGGDITENVQMTQEAFEKEQQDRVVISNNKSHGNKLHYAFLPSIG